MSPLPRSTKAVLSVPILALAGAVSLAAQPAIDPANYRAPVKIACVGDSITEGAGAPPGQSYPDQLQKLLGSQWQVRNFGVGGRTLLRKGDFPYWAEKAFHDAQAFQPDVVIIMLGTNDTKPQNWAHHGEFYTDYRDMVETFANLASKPRIYLCRPCPVPEPGNFGINEANVQIEIPLIDKLVEENRLGTIDMHAALEKTPQFLPDHVHPNAAGAGAMAKAAFQVLTGKAPQP